MGDGGHRPNRRPGWAGTARRRGLPGVRSRRRGSLDAGRALLAQTDELTAEHCDDVVRIADAIGARMGLPEPDRERLVAAAAMHDIGKVAVGREIIVRPGPLTDAEWALIRRHTVEGERMLRSMPGMGDVAALVRHAHERYDGYGYPDGLSGEQIPLLSRIVFCADAFDAIRSDRPYRAGRPVPAALAELRAAAGSQFDPEVVEALHAAVRDLRLVTPRRRVASPQLALAGVLCVVAGGAWGAAILGSDESGEQPRASLPPQAPQIADPGGTSQPRSSEPRRADPAPAEQRREVADREPEPEPEPERRLRSERPEPRPTANPRAADAEPPQLRVDASPDADAVAPTPPASAEGVDALAALPSDPEERVRVLTALRYTEVLRSPRTAGERKLRDRALALLVLARLQQR